MEACTAPASGDRYAPPYSAFPGERQNAKAAIQPSPKARQTYPFEINGLLSLSNPQRGRGSEPRAPENFGLPHLLDALGSCGQDLARIDGDRLAKQINDLRTR